MPPPDGSTLCSPDCCVSVARWKIAATSASSYRRSLMMSKDMGTLRHLLHAVTCPDNVTHRRLALAILVAASLDAGAQVGAPPAADKPNVVLVLMDDMGYGDIGSYGVKDAHTPNLDRLAREGVRLTDAYANGANCSRTRTGLITGQYQQRWGVE